MLEIYRRHNPQKCSSTDTVVCTNRRRPCPIWIRGTDAQGVYHRKPLRTRDWTVAEKRKNGMDSTGELPKPTTKYIIEQLKDRFIASKTGEELKPETIRQYRILFRQMEAFAQEKGFRYVTEFTLAELEAFRHSWKVGAVRRQKHQERLKAVFRYANKHKMILENPAHDLGTISVRSTKASPFENDEWTRMVRTAKTAIENAAGKEQKTMAQKAYALLLLMRYSGLRISDASMLRVDALRGDRIAIRTIKTDVDVAMRLPQIAVEALKAFKPTTATHFFWSGNSTVAKQTDLYRNRYLKPIFISAKVHGKLNPHRLRDTFSARLLEAGMSLNDVAKLLGDTVSVVMKHYSQYTKGGSARLEDAVLAANGFHVLQNI